jgi:hypothetical protein
MTHPALCALPSVLAEGDVRVLVGGEFADEVCGSLLTLPDWARSTTLWGLIGGLHRLPVGTRDLLRWVKHKMLGLVRRPSIPFVADLPEFIWPELRQQYRSWVATRRRLAADEPSARRDLALRTEVDGFVAMNWEAASTLGVRRSFPFFNREVLELAFECHPSELVGPGTKKLLRAALRGDVPEPNLLRADKGHWGHYLRGALVELPAPLPTCLAPIVRTEWCTKTPRTVDRAAAVALAQLTRFAQDLTTRFRQRSLY